MRTRVGAHLSIECGGPGLNLRALCQGGLGSGLDPPVLHFPVSKVEALWPPSGMMIGGPQGVDTECQAACPSGAQP